MLPSRTGVICKTEDQLVETCYLQMQNSQESDCLVRVIARPESESRGQSWSK